MNFINSIIGLDFKTAFTVIRVIMIIASFIMIDMGLTQMEHEANRKYRQKHTFGKMSGDTLALLSHAEEASIIMDRLNSDMTKMLEEATYSVAMPIEAEYEKYEMANKPEFLAAFAAKDYEGAYAVISALDDKGFKLYRAAEYLTGIDPSKEFPYEDNRGAFEELDGFGLLYWLDIAKFGAVNWEQLDNGYEKALPQRVDYESPEVRDFHAAVYLRAIQDILGKRMPAAVAC